VWAGICGRLLDRKDRVVNLANYPVLVCDSRLTGADTTFKWLNLGAAELPQLAAADPGPTVSQQGDPPLL